MDSKVSLNAWTRHQATDEEDDRAPLMKEHLSSIRAHITSLGEKRYAEIPELNALDFVLMFVPIEAALIEALRADPELPAFALRHRVAVLSPTNLLATLRTVASVWMVHKQNTNAQEIAGRAGLLYDKFKGFADNLQNIGMRIRQAQESYDSALGQLSRGPGNLVRQVEMLRELGARNTKQLDPALLEADDETADERGAGDEDDEALPASADEEDDSRRPPGGVH
jgi:DNA recombination protein RmuC